RTYPKVPPLTICRRKATENVVMCRQNAEVLLWREPDDAERRQRDLGRVRQTVPALVARPHFTTVGDAAARPLAVVGVEHLQPPACLGQADAIAVLRCGCEIGDAGQHL